MNRASKLKEIWQKIENEGTEGLVKRAFDIPSCLKTFCTYSYPDRYFGIAFSFHQDINLDISVFKDLSELNISLFKDNSFPDAKLLLIQLTNREPRVNDIFATICANIIDSILNAESEREGVRLVIAQLRKWKDLFSKRRIQRLSAQEQQGLYGELFFLRKLLLSIDKTKALITWVGPEKAPKDFQSDMWAVEVKSSSATNNSGILINGEFQLDESNIEQLFLYNLIVEVSQRKGESLPDIIAAIREFLADNQKASVIFEEKLLLAGYYAHDEEFYQEYNYCILKEQYFDVSDDFPRIKKNELRLGVFDVKYCISLEPIVEKKVNENNVINTIETYEGN